MEYISFSFASAKAFEYNQRVAPNADHSLLRSVTGQVEFLSVIDGLDVRKPHIGEHKDPTTKTKQTSD